MPSSPCSPVRRFIVSLRLRQFSMRHCLFLRCGAPKSSNPPVPLVCVYFRFFFAFFCYVYANIDLGPLFCFIFKAETFVFQYKMRPLLLAVPCVVSFFATSTLIFIWGLFFASLSRPKPLFSNIKCALFSLRSRASFHCFAMSSLIFEYYIASPCGAAHPSRPTPLFRLYFQYFWCFSHFFATSTLIFVLGLFFASSLRPKRMFSSIKCVSSPCGGGGFSFFRYVYANFRLGLHFCFIYYYNTLHALHT